MLPIRKPLWLGCLLAQGLVWAQGALRDPTTPPSAGMLQPAPAAAPAQRQQVRSEGQSLPSGGQISIRRQDGRANPGVVPKNSLGAGTVPMAPLAVSKKNLSSPGPDQ